MTKQAVPTAIPARESAEKVRRMLLQMLSECDAVSGSGPAYSLPVSGKLARTAFTILMGDCLFLDRNISEKIAVCAELTHTASLLHDDCIDSASMRRGRPTANKMLGINRAILLGDLVVSHAFSLCFSVSPEIAYALIKAVGRMSEGALQEERFRYRKRTRQEYLETLALKTGSLFQWCAFACACMAGKPQFSDKCMSIGMETGISFQIIDDVIDFESDKSELGKNALKDILDGRLTMPALMAIDHSDTADALAESLKNAPYPDPCAAKEISGLIQNSGCLEKARSAAAASITTLTPLLHDLPNHESSMELKTYLWTLTQRTS